MSRTKIYLAPLGCPKNQVDGELMLGAARARGYVVVEDPKEADVLVVNTCAFIDAARAESVDAILELARIKQERQGRRLVVTGCMAERYTDELAAELPEVDALVGTGALNRFVDALEAPRDGAPAVFKGAKHYLPAAAMERVVSERDGSAYLKVSEGCDHECAFCVIPQIRGRHESRPLEDIAAEAERLAAEGVVEVNLIAQDLSAYGKDLGLRDGLASLLFRLGRVRGLERIRCYYLYPNTLSDGSVEAMAAVDTVCRYIDLPLQHADSTVLRAMRRGGDPDRLRRLVDRVRGRLEGAVVRSSFIVGFPGETESSFATLCRFVEETGFDRIAVFTYSREEGSPAAELPGQVPHDVAVERRDRLLAIQEPISEARLAARVGSIERVLVCGPDPEGSWYGRTDGQGPEIDGVTWLDQELPASRGRCLPMRIVGSDAFDLWAEPVGSV